MSRDFVKWYTAFHTDDMSEDCCLEIHVVDVAAVSKQAIPSHKSYDADAT
mgnify:CR=1 FL=1